MIIFRYNSNDNACKINDIFQSLKNQCESIDEDIIALPDDWDILLNCSTYELYNYIKEIENIIRKKEIINES